MKFLCQSKLAGYCMLDSRRPEQDGDDNGTTGTETWLQLPARRLGLDENWYHKYGDLASETATEGRPGRYDDLKKKFGDDDRDDG